MKRLVYWFFSLPWPIRILVLIVIPVLMMRFGGSTTQLVGVCIFGGIFLLRIAFQVRHWLRPNGVSGNPPTVESAPKFPSASFRPHNAFPAERREPSR